MKLGSAEPSGPLAWASVSWAGPESCGAVCGSVDGAWVAGSEGLGAWALSPEWAAIGSPAAKTNERNNLGLIPPHRWPRANTVQAVAFEGPLFLSSARRVWRCRMEAEAGLKA